MKISLVYGLCSTAKCPACEPGGACVSPGVCECLPGFRGSLCQESLCPGGCLNGGTCFGPNICACLPGWSGTDCSIRKYLSSYLPYFSFCHFLGGRPRPRLLESNAVTSLSEEWSVVRNLNMPIDCQPWSRHEEVVCWGSPGCGW